MKSFVFCLLSFVLAFVASAQAQQRPNLLNRGLSRNRPAAVPASQPQPSTSTSASASAEVPAFNWDAAPVDIVLQAYGERVGKTILKDPQVPAATITLKSREGQKLTNEEYLEAIEIILEMNQIHLEPYGESFIRALPRKDVRKEGIPLIKSIADRELKESGKVVSMMMSFENIATEEAQKALEGLKSNSGILLVFERTNSILVTDTEQNIKRMLEVKDLIDKESPVTEVVEYVQIKYANANDVKQVIDNIVQEAMKEQEKNGKRPQNGGAQSTKSASSSSPLDKIFKKVDSQEKTPAGNPSLVTTVSDADRGMIRGKVVTIADERSNKILIITNAQNMKFFKDVIAALDVETTPDTVVKVYRLKYAEAEDVSDMINDLIGNSSSSKSGGKANQNQNAKNGQSGSVTKNTTQTTKKPANQRSGEVKAGELNKDNTTVLADKRINGLVVMTAKELVPTIEQIIESMDIKLAQVLIETAIIEVTLGKNLNTGVDWVQNEWMGKDPSGKMGGGGGSNSGTLTGMSSSKTYAEWIAEAKSALGSDISTAEIENYITQAKKYASSGVSPIGSGLTYLFKSDKLNLNAVITAAKTDARSKYIASPIIMTVDNKEATINATDMTYLLKGFTSSGNSYSTIAVPDYEQKELGIEIKTTPKINPNGTVMLTVETKYTQKGAEQTIKYTAGNSQEGGAGALQDVSVPTTATREMSADVLLENMQTVILGGLTDTYKSESETGIPILKDIPIVGKWLFGKVVQDEIRKELLIFMTPYVMDDGAAAQAEALRRKKVLSDSRSWDDRGWSLSGLADPVSKRELLRRIKDEWKLQDEERQNRMAIEQEKVERVRKLQEMSAEERAKWLLMHKEELAEEQQEELEEKMLDKDSQEGLKKLVDGVKAKKLAEADVELKKAEKETAAENERAKLDAERKAEVEEKK